MARTKYPALDLRFAPGPGAGTLQDFLYAELDAFEPVAIHEHEAGDGWRVFFPTHARRDDARAALRAEFGNALLDLSPVDVDDEDWARRSQADLKAVRIGRIIVAPPWDIPAASAARSLGPSDPRSSDITVIIEPSMGFGTGHHATTRLCLELLQQVDVDGRRVIDAGTGSGVLAIAAAKLGASSVLAVDNDPDALLNARENVERNNVQSIVDLREAGVEALEAPPAVVVLANLTAAVLQRAALDLRRLAGTDAVLVVSGFGPDELDDVCRAFGTEAVRQAHEGGWTAALLRI